MRQEAERRILTAQAPANGPPFNVGVPSSPFDVQGIQQRVNEISQAVARGGLTGSTRQEFQNQLASIATGLRAELDRTQPVPDNPVIDTPEQWNFVINAPPEQRITIREQMDLARSRVGLPGLESQRIGLMKDLQATNEAFGKIIEDINSNRDLPKGLARRRIAEVEKEQKERILQLTGQLDIMNQQIKDANGLVNREFDIISKEQDEEERQRDNARQMITQMITTGAIGSLDKSTLAQWARQSGFDVGSLEQVAAAVKAKDERKVEESITRLAQAEERLDLSRQRFELAQEKASSPLSTDATNTIYQTTYAQALNEGLSAADAAVAAQRVVDSVKSRLTQPTAKKGPFVEQLPGGYKAPARTTTPAPRTGPQFTPVPQKPEEKGFFSRLFSSGR